MFKALLQLILLTATLVLAACAPHRAPTTAPPPVIAPSDAPSAVPSPLPTYPYEPGFWV